jgi:hypothetical protein
MTITYRPSGQSISLVETARNLAPTKAGKPVHPSTVLRWVRTGVRAADGSIVKLAARRHPGGWQTTWQDVNAFLDRITQAALEKADPHGSPVPSVPPDPSPARQRELDQTDRDLAAFGYRDTTSTPSIRPKPSKPAAARS